MDLSVLIVDDSAVMRKLIERSLSQAGFGLHKAYHAASGVEALAIVGDLPDLDAVLCDVHMREMDGFALVRELRKIPRYRQTPILMVTTEGEAQKLEEARSAGADGFLAKPFTPEKLRETLDQLLKGFGEPEQEAPGIRIGRIVNIVVQGVQETFQTLLGLNAKNRAPFLSAEPKMFDGVSAIVGLAGRTTLSMHCSEAASAFLTSRMLGVRTPGLGLEAVDAIGEIANVISGVVKRRMADAERVFELSMPKVLSGPKHSVEPWVRWPNIGVEFQFEGGAMIVLLSLAGGDAKRN